MAKASRPKSIPSCIGNHLDCPVCLEPFEEPKVLGCLHSFCTNCLEKMLQKQTDTYQQRLHAVPSLTTQLLISCPVCRKHSSLPADGIQGLPDNFLIKNLLDSMKEPPSPSADKMATRLSFNASTASSQGARQARFSSQPVEYGPTKCGNCGDEGIEFCCLDCNIALCPPCGHVHRKQLTTRKHSTRHLDGLSTSFEPSLLHSGPHMCSEHTDEVLKLYCEKCGLCICRDCALLTHRDHNYIFLKDAVKEKKQYLERLIADGEMTLDNLRQSASRLQDNMDELEKNADTTASTIRQFIDKHLQAIQQRRAELLQEVDAQLRVRLKGHRMTLMDLESKQQAACRLLEVSKSVLERGSAWDVVNMCRDIEMQNLAAFATDPPWETSQGKEIVFHGSGECARALLAGLGEVKGLESTAHGISKFVVERPVSTHTQLSTILTVINTAPSTVHVSVAGHKNRSPHLSIRCKDLTAEVVHPKGQELIGSQAIANLTSITDNEDGTYRVTCFIQAPGTASVHIQYKGQPIRGSPLLLEAQLLGTPLQQLGQRGTQSGEFNSPYDIAVDTDGNIFIADTGNHRVQVLDASGRILRMITYTYQGRAIKPTSIAVHPDGRVVIGDYNHKCVRVFSRNGQHLHSFRAPANTGISAQASRSSSSCGSNTETRALESYGMTFNPVSGQLLVTDYSERCVLGFTMEGTHVLTIEVTALYSSSHQQPNTPSAAQLHGPLGIDTDREGNFYVADFGQHSAHVFSAAGNLIHRFGTQASGSSKDSVASNMQRPWGLCVEGSGHLAISEHDGNCISIFSSDGRLLHRLPSSGPASLEGPTGMAMDGQGRLWVVERSGHCAKLF